MKLVNKLTIAFLAGVCAILVVNALLRVRREIALFESYSFRNHKLIGRALGAAVSAVWHTEGAAPALALVADANAGEGRVHVEWIGEAALQRLSPPVSSSALERGEAVTRVSAPARGGELARCTYVPITVDGGGRSAIELSESLVEERAYVRKTILAAVWLTAALVGMCGLLAMLLGVWLVGRPMRALVVKARRVGAGDFGGPLRLRQRDEVGDLAHEMNAMCEQLALAHARLEAEAAARIATVEQLRHADRLTTVGKLASGIAHELGTPLNVVSGRAQMIVRGEAVGLEAVECARIVVDASTRMTKIIRQLLDFARRKSAHKEPRDVRVVVGETVSMLRALAGKKRIDLLFSPPDEPLVTELDAGQLHQALANLLVNAVDATPEGGGPIELRVARSDAQPQDGQPAAAPAYVRIEVRDRGTGIEPDRLGHVFEPFFTTKDVGEGTGLGLSVTYGIVQEHLGWIAVESEVGAGSVFTIHLPQGPAT